MPTNFAVRTAGLLAMAMLFAGSGCLACKVISAPVKVAAKTVVVAGEAAGAVVTTTGRVAVKAVRATGSVAETGLDSVDATARLARTGTVTIADAASGAVVRVPWTEGITLAAAGDAGKVGLAARTVEVMRGGKIVAATSGSASPNLVLHSGDVVRLAR
jgi:hypothetical protein